ncbi:raftlin isoform X1 [Tupaia chinensis]|uniref:raftlin isoform X1 n=1 Tax=Tupaia chinensis TaxID=246437 RepID=UPI000FFB2749|nr:raftlin isoform X1 [Tupaia chinensis]
MGCGLNKLEKRSEKRPGNIYSTLKRPQVETKVDVAYEYRFLDFTTLSTAELPRSSAVRLSSLRDLPAQLLELYQQGFSLAALHPFVQPTHEWEKTPLQHIFRAILIKKTDRSQKTDVPNDGYVLELDCCSSLDHLTDQKIIPEFIKKVQEAASQGLKFVGVIPQYHSPPGSPASCEADARGGRGTQEGPRSLENEDLGAPDTCDAPAERHQSPGPGGEAPVAEQPSLPSGEGDGGEFSPGRGSTTLDVPDGTPAAVRGQPLPGKMEILALFNKPKSHQKYRQYYPVTIPLRISKNGQTVSGLDANWLEHMSDHFRKGGMLVNAVFYLGMVNDSLHGLTDGVFIFEAISTEDEKTIQGYDAIVVEQWTVLDGAEVRTDYVPLLSSLAAYGWQLTCVLPTPVVRTTSPCVSGTGACPPSRLSFSRDRVYLRNPRRRTPSSSGGSPGRRCAAGARGSPRASWAPGTRGPRTRTRAPRSPAEPWAAGSWGRCRETAAPRCGALTRRASRRQVLCRMGPPATAGPRGAAPGTPTLQRMPQRGATRSPARRETEAQARAPKLELADSVSGDRWFRLVCPSHLLPLGFAWPLL